MMCKTSSVVFSTVLRSTKVGLLVHWGIEESIELCISGVQDELVTSISQVRMSVNLCNFSSIIFAMSFSRVKFEI